MKNYDIQTLNNNIFKGLLLCLTSDSIMDYLDKLENEAIILNSSGIVLIDQLLLTGNNPSRFISCSFNYGKFDFTTAKNVNPSDALKKISIDLLQKNFDMLSNSILTDKQKENIRQGVII